MWRNHQDELEQLRQELSLRELELQQHSVQREPENSTELRRDREELQSQKVRLELQVQKLECELKTRPPSSKKSAATCEKCAATREENVRLVQMVGELKNRCVRLEMELSVPNGRETSKEGSQSEMALLTQENRTLRIAQADLEKRLAELADEAATQDAKLVPCQDQTQAKRLEEENTRLRAECESAEKKAAGLETKLASGVSREDYDWTLSRLADRDALAIERDDLVKKCAGLEAVTSSVAEKDKRIQELQSSVDELTMVNRSLLKKAEAYTELQVKYANDTMAFNKSREELVRRLQQAAGKVFPREINVS